LNRIK